MNSFGQTWADEFDEWRPKTIPQTWVFLFLPVCPSAVGFMTTGQPSTKSSDGELYGEAEPPVSVQITVRNLRNSWLPKYPPLQSKTLIQPCELEVVSQNIFAYR